MHQELNGKIRTLEARLAILQAALEARVAPLPEDLSRNQTGYLAEALATYRAARQGFSVYQPPAQSPGCDLLLGKGGRFFRCEVKCTTNLKTPVSLRRLRYAGGPNRVHETYSPGELDFFILVNLLTEELWVIPQSAVEGVSTVTMTESSPFCRFKDAWDQVLSTSRPYR